MTLRDEPKMLEYRFPIRPGRFLAFLQLPEDLTKAEVARLEQFLDSLVAEPEETRA